jgi:hypothetical protein
MPSAVPQRSWPGLIGTRVWRAEITIRSDLEQLQVVPVFEHRSANDALPPLPQGEPPLPQGAVRVIIYQDYNDDRKLVCVYPPPYIA